MRVLIIDDSRALRGILEEMMKEIGFQEVAQAENGKEALDVLRAQGKFDLALVDWNMPVMNGLEFVQNVRANAEYADLKLMMVTTESEMEKVVGALEAGANEYVMKPFTKEIILDKLQLLGLDAA